MKRMLPIIPLLILFNLVACGDGEVKEDQQEFTPRPVPSEYSGLSIEELKAKIRKAYESEIRSEHVKLFIEELEQIIRDGGEAK